jgi:hypothetical protein
LGQECRKQIFQSGTGGNMIFIQIARFGAVKQQSHEKEIKTRTLMKFFFMGFSPLVKNATESF